MLNRTFWKNRRVLVTGHTGFKGSWMTLWLESLGAKVTGYALDPPTQPNLFEQAGVAEYVDSIRGDVRDFPALRAVVEDCRPEIVFHMAAQSVVKRGYEDPIETYGSNVMGTVHMFEAVRNTKRPCAVVNVTSDKCYENREWCWGYREIDALGGDDPYSNSKACSELVTHSYRESFFPNPAYETHGVSIATARAGNVIGGGDWTSNQLIPDLIRAFLQGEPCLIRNPLAIRPWQFVLEPLHGYLLLAERLIEEGPRFASAWNFGPADSNPRPVSWIADRLSHLWGEDASWRQDGADHAKETMLLQLDASKARMSLQWPSLLPLCPALEWIVEWYREFQAGNSLRKVTRTQIERYETLAASQRNA